MKNTDTILRRDALNVVYTSLTTRTGAKDDSVFVLREQVIDGIKNAPAEPTIVRCEDCVNRVDKHYEDGVVKHTCRLIKGYQFPLDFYCKSGERRKND